MKKKQMQFRQGDVFIRRVRKKIKGDLVPLDAGRIVLMYGEVTGHAHAIVSDKAALWREAGQLALSMLQVDEAVTLKHEEHSPITIEPGTYEVVRQREYHPEELRYVAD